MNINELGNEEVLFLYFVNLHRLEDYQDILNKKEITDSLSILDYGAVTVTRFLLDEEIANIEKSESFRLTNQLHEKLTLLVELIEEADPDLFNKVKSYFEKDEF